VAVSVVDRFETVYVQQQQTEWPPVPERARHFALQLALEAAAICKTRQVIREGRFLAGIEVGLEVEQRARARQQKVDVRRVCDITQRAHFRAAPRVMRVVSGGGLNDDRNESRQRVGAHAPRQLIPVQLGHHHVRDNQVGLKGIDRDEARLAVIRGAHLITGHLQRDGQQHPFVRVIIDDENTRFFHHKLTVRCVK
jgi:hypothetical protein